MLGRDRIAILEPGIADLTPADTGKAGQLHRQPFGIGVAFAQLQQTVLAGAVCGIAQHFVDLEILGRLPQYPAERRAAVGARQRLGVTQKTAATAKPIMPTSTSDEIANMPKRTSILLTVAWNTLCMMRTNT